jgi:hypothetical protein
MKNDVCDHPQCKNARSTTKHIFWDCEKYAPYRKKYLDEISRKKGILKKHNKFALKEINMMLNNNCFQNTSVCPGNAQQLLDTYNLEQFDPYRLKVPEEGIFKGEETHGTIDIGGFSYNRVYTDGSAINGTSRSLARAGWGVFYGKESNLNIASKLHGPVQTSYRAEVRALLHAVQTAGSPICVFVDCQGVVNTVNGYISSGHTPPVKILPVFQPIFCNLSSSCI